MNQRTNNNALGLTSLKWYRHYMYQEKKKEGDWPVLRKPWMHQYVDLRTTLEIAKKVYRNGKKNKCIDISSDKLEKSHTRKPGYGKGNLWKGNLWKGNLRKESESLLIAVHNNAIKTNYIKAKIDNTQQNSKRKLCGEKDETINHISKCSQLTQKEYKRRHDWLVKVIHWELCKKSKFYLWE